MCCPITTKDDSPPLPTSLLSSLSSTYLTDTPLSPVSLVEKSSLFAPSTRCNPHEHLPFLRSLLVSRKIQPFQQAVRKKDEMSQPMNIEVRWGCVELKDHTALPPLTFQTRAFPTSLSSDFKLNVQPSRSSLFSVCCRFC